MLRFRYGYNSKEQDAPGGRAHKPAANPERYG